MCGRHDFEHLGTEYNDRSATEELRTRSTDSASHDRTDLGTLEAASTPVTSTSVAPSPVGELTPPEWLAARRVSIHGASLEDLVGLERAKREVSSLAARLLNRATVAAAGARLPRGVLLHGPAGCGKTSLARALAAQLGSNTRFYELSAAELTAERIGSLGDWLATGSTDTVIFFDEIDLIALDRSERQHTETTRGALFAMLSLLDGLRPHDGAVFVAATNNNPVTFDAAISRAGRFGMHVEVGYPSLTERTELFKRLALLRRVADGIDWDRAAELAGPWASPADVIQVMDDGLALALADNVDHLDGAHLDEALERFGQVVQHARLEGEARTNRAIHEAGHAIVAWLEGWPVRRIIIDKPEPDGTTSGLTGIERDQTAPVNEASARIGMRVALAGKAAEALILDPAQASVGSVSDIDQATRLAQLRADAGTLPGAPMIDRNLSPASPRLGDALAIAIEQAIAIEYDAAQQLLRDRVPALRAFAAVVEGEGVMGGDEIREALLGLGLPERTDHSLVTSADSNQRKDWWP